MKHIIGRGGGGQKKEGGLGMGTPTREHFRLARNIIMNFHALRGFGEYEALHESAVDEEDLSRSKSVDVAFLRGGTKNAVFVEIVTEQQAATAMFRGKLVDLLTNGGDTFEEGFVLVYAPGPHRFQRWGFDARGEVTAWEGASRSEVLDLDLARLTHTPPHRLDG